MIKIFKPCDFHVHLREGDLASQVLTENKKHFQKILIMPNLNIPITNSNLLNRYRNFLLKNNKNLEILFTIYLNQNCSIKDLAEMKNKELFFSVKLYPQNATTNSRFGVNDVKKMSKFFEFLEKNNIPLCIHGEHIQLNDDPFEREKKFLDNDLNWIRKNFTNLKITLEHITTKDSIDFVKQHNLIGATVTTHHLLENTYTFFGNHLKPELFCKPIIKNFKHQEALQKIVLSGHKKFFFGSDSAPHLKSKKFTEFCCAGVYSTKYSISNIIEFFVKNKKLSNLDKFLTVNGNEHYELDYKKEKITYKKDTNYKFKKFSKYKNDFLINYNFYKNHWRPV